MGLYDWQNEERRKVNLALTRYYSVAQQACNRTMQILELGPTNQGLCYRLLKWTDKEIFETERHKRLVEIRKEYEKKFKEQGLYNNVVTYLLRKEMLSLIADYAKTAKTGTCGEYGAVVFEYLRKEHSGGAAFNIEFVRCRGAFEGHYVVVLNRDFGTDLTTLSKWNTTAYICDPWNGKVWTWNEYAQGMFAYSPEEALSFPPNGTPYFHIPDWWNW